MNNEPNIQLFNADWRDVLTDYENNAFELAIVDPPYGIDIAGNGGSVGKYGAQHRAKKWDIEKPTPMYFEELKRVSKNQIIWGANHYVEDLTNSRGWIVWSKETNGHFSDCEIAYTSFDKPIKMFQFVWDGFRQGYKGKKENRIHPTQKPVALYRWLLQNYASEGDKILDTHLGSGSIAIACHEEKHDLVGCEIDEDYFNGMMKRFNEYKKQLQLF